MEEAVVPQSPPDREPLISFRSPSRSVLTRLAAHVLIRLLVISPMPPELQALSALFPVSVLWPLVAPQEAPGAGEAVENLKSVAEDPFGNTSTFSITQYKGADGWTAVGRAGGLVEGPEGSGLALRIPEGAVKKGIVFKLEPIAKDDTALGTDLPDLSVDDDDVKATGGFGAAMRVTTSEPVAFERPLKLVFPVSDELKAFLAEEEAAGRRGRLEDAFFSVYQRELGPCPNDEPSCDESVRPVSYSTLDIAKLEGTGDNARVVTASYPFSGFTAVGNLMNAIGIYVWACNQLEPAVPFNGVVTGQALRPTWLPKAAEPVVEGVNGLTVRLMRGGIELGKAETHTDGRYTIEVKRFTTNPGTVETVADDGKPYSASVALVAENDSLLYFGALQRLVKMAVFGNYAVADITLPTAAPPAPVPLLRTVVMTVDADGKRHDAGGTVAESTPLLIGFQVSATSSDAGVTITSVAIDDRTENLSAVADRPDASPRLDWVVRDNGSRDDGLVALPLGVHTITASATPNSGGAAIHTSFTLRVVAEGGGITTDNSVRPRILTVRTVPAPDARGVPVTTYAEIAFTEPVTNVYDNIHLRDADGDVPVELWGMTTDTPPRSILLTDPGHEAVTAVTVIPLLGLKFSTSYTLEASSAIVDLDKDPNDPNRLAPKPLDCGSNPPTCATEFKTFAPQHLPPTGVGQFWLAGLGVLEDRAYAAEVLTKDLLRNDEGGRLRIFDLSQAVAPKDITPPNAGYMDFPPTSLSVLQRGGRRLVGVTATSRVWFLSGGTLGQPALEPRSSPGNLLLFDVTDGRPNLTGAASLTVGNTDGRLDHVVLSGDSAYVATRKKGIQVVKLADMEAGFPSAAAEQTQMLMYDGKTVGAITIPLDVEDGKTVLTLQDLEVGEYTIEEGGVPMSVPLVIGTGWTPAGRDNVLANASPNVLAIASPSTSTKPLYLGPVSNEVGSHLRSGAALALMRAGSREFALIAGVGVVACPTPPGDCVPSAGAILATVDLADRLQPNLVGVISLGGAKGMGDAVPTDIVLYGTTAVVSGGGMAVLVNLVDPEHPFISGTLKDVGSILALGNGVSDGRLFSTDRSYIAGGAFPPKTGLHLATLTSMVMLLDKDKNVLPKVRLPKHTQTYVYALVPGAGEKIDEVEVSIIDDKGGVRTPDPNNGIPTTTKLTLTRDKDGVGYSAPLRIVDKDCAIELAFDPKTDEQIVAEGKGCINVAGSGPVIESGPWSRVRVRVPKNPSSHGAVEGVTDLHAFRLVTIGDSLTQGVQHGIVVHKDQRYSYPQQLSDQINMYLKQKYESEPAKKDGPQVVFKQAMIGEPGVGIPPLGNPHGDGPEDKRLNLKVQPVNNLGLSGARVAHLHTAKDGAWPAYPAWEQDRDPEKKRFASPVDNHDEPKSVWPYALRTLGTAVEQAVEMDPSLLIVIIGNNDALNAPVSSDMRELTSVKAFEKDYNDLMNEVTRLTAGRAGIVLGDIPDVATIPHMRDLGEYVGALPFTKVSGAVTSLVENSFLSNLDEYGECHGIVTDGICPGGKALGAKVGIKTMLKNDKYGKIFEQSLTQKRLTRQFVGEIELSLFRKEVMDPSELWEIGYATDRFNACIKGWAQREGWPVIGMRELFRRRTSTNENPQLLNGLFTGTPRSGAADGSRFYPPRGRGNTLLSWDGVHPNSAGYSLVANEAVAAINAKLSATDFGGLEKGTTLPRIQRDTITDILKTQYLALPRTRIDGWQALLSTVE